MESLMFVGASLGGNLAGGAAAQAIMGKNELAADTSIPGIKNADIMSGKDNYNVAQVDPSQSIDYFKQAADKLGEYYNQGLNYYNAALDNASKAITAGYAAGNAVLAPVASNAMSAYNEQMKMLGITPVSAGSSTYQSGLDALGGDYVKYSQDIAKAERLNDPTARAAAVNSIQQNFNQYKSQLQTNLTSAQEAYKSAGGAKEVLSYNDWATGELGRQYRAGLKYDSEQGQDSYISDAQRAHEAYVQQTNAQNAAALAPVTAAQNALNVANSAGTTLIGNWSNQFDANGVGYTGQQVTDKIRSTPGYAFIEKMGTQAVERQGAAKGMLGSGNTLVALTDYNQNLALNYLDHYISSLQTAYAEGSGAISQMAANKISQGTDIANIQSAKGQAGLSTYQGIGQANYNALTHIGDVTYDAAKTNMNAQNTAMMQARAIASDQAIAGGQQSIQRDALNLQAGQQQGYGGAILGNAYRSAWSGYQGGGSSSSGYF